MDFNLEISVWMFGFPKNPVVEILRQTFEINSPKKAALKFIS